MIVLLLILLVLCFWGFRFPGYHDDFLSVESTTPIKGIFAVLIFYSHIRGYLTLSDAWYNSSYSTILNYIGQLMVAMFFFYSGFGIWESFKNKPGYAESFFKKRFLKTLLRFDIPVALFILVQLLIPVFYSTREYLLCWIGWESVGNSNWYIFIILCLYLFAWGSLWVQKKFRRGGILTIVLMTAALWILIKVSDIKPIWWINTMAAFPLGMIASRFKDDLFPFLKKGGVPYLSSLIALALFLLSYRLLGIDGYGVTSCLFCVAVVLTSSWIRISNAALNWLGKNAFTIYIIQRLPMIVLSAWGLNANTFVFVLAAIILTIVLAECLSRLYSALDARLFANG